jgi:hypothetical protein
MRVGYKLNDLITLVTQIVCPINSAPHCSMVIVTGRIDGSDARMSDFQKCRSQDGHLQFVAFWPLTDTPSRTIALNKGTPPPTSR